MAALTVGIVIADAWFLHSERIIKHLLLGGITTGLFYVLCDHGYEMINWVFMAIIPVYVLVSIVTTTVKSAVHETDETDSDDDDYNECGRCGAVAKSCSCVKHTTPQPPSDSISSRQYMTNPYTGLRINTEDPTPMTRRWYHNKTNL